MDKPIPEAVVRQRLQAVLNLSESARCLGVAQAKNDQGAIDYWTAKVAEYEAALTTSQQQGQAVACECPIPLDDPPNMHAPACVVRQPMQQGGGEVCRHEWITTGGGNGGPRRSLRCSKCHVHRDHTAPPSAPAPYDRKRIAWELERTAMGDGYYGSALYAAKDFPEATPIVRSLLDRWATGKEGGLSDRTDLCAFALQIYAADGESPSSPVGVEAAARRLLEAYDGNAHPFEAAAAAQAMRDALAQQPAAVDGAEPLPEFLERVAQEVVERDTLAGTFAPGIAQALRGRASILRRALATQHQQPTT